MNLNYGYQHEKLGACIRALMIPTPGGNSRAIAGAMHEFTLGFHRAEVHEDARPMLNRINRIMDGAGTWEERAERLSEDEILELSTAFWELDRKVSRLYFDAD